MKEYIYIIIIVFLFIVLLLNIFVLLFLRKRPKEDLEDKLKAQQTESDFKLEVLKLINESNQKHQSTLFTNIESRFEHINKSVNSNISESFKKTDETFVNVVERLTKIDEQNKNINKLSEEVLTLNNILTDKATRGTFGEVQLYKLLESVLGNNENLYVRQTKLSNGSIPDALVFAPKPLGKIAIDSKFPLENYQRSIDPSLSKAEKESYIKEFNKDLKKHIDDISRKYIVKDETADQAIMFIPAESIYLEVVSNQIETINYAYSKNVWITSPTTLIASLTVIEAISNSVRQNEQTTLLVEELKYLANEFRKYKERTDSVQTKIKQLSDDIDKLAITNNKIYNRFSEIEKGKI